jgi:hypothetical protein
MCASFVVVYNNSLELVCVKFNDLYYYKPDWAMLHKTAGPTTRRGPVRQRQQRHRQRKHDGHPTHRRCRHAHRQQASHAARRSLQSIAKRFGIKANAKSTIIITSLIDRGYISPAPASASPPCTSKVETETEPCNKPHCQGRGILQRHHACTYLVIK